MLHRTRIKHKFRNITICGTNVSHTKNTKFLDIIIDNKLKWFDHINYIKNKITKSIEIINTTHNFLSENILTNLYYTFIYPYLICCTEIWRNTNDIHLDSLTTILKSLRVITFSHHRDSTVLLFQKLNILNFKKLVTQRIALLMFKYHKGILRDPINNLFSTNNNRHNYHTRQTNDLQTNTGKGKMFINISVFTVSVFGTTSKKIKLMYHMLALTIIQKHTY